MACLWEDTQLIFKEVYNPLFGIDITKKKTVVCYLTSNHDKPPTLETREFETSPGGYINICKWAIATKVPYAVMENKREFWIPLYAALSDIGVQCLIAIPHFAKTFEGYAKAASYAEWLTKLSCCDIGRPRLIYDKIFLKIRESYDNCLSLTAELMEWKNRLKEIKKAKGSRGKSGSKPNTSGIDREYWKKEISSDGGAIQIVKEEIDAAFLGYIHIKDVDAVKICREKIHNLEEELFNMSSKLISQVNSL